MADTQEPSIEEILASIRQIISDDEPAVAPPPPPAPKPVAPPPAPKEEVLELTEPVMPLPRPTPPPRMQIDMREMEPEPDLPDEPALPSMEETESILTQRASSAALEAFHKLAYHIPVDRSGRPVTIEDVTRELLRPLLRQWLDQNLPRMVEKVVQAELERLSQRARD